MQPVSASDVPMKGHVTTATGQRVDGEVPRALTTEEVKRVVEVGVESRVSSAAWLPPVADALLCAAPLPPRRTFAKAPSTPRPPALTAWRFTVGRGIGVQRRR